MEKTNEKYSAYIQILKEELIPAMGCTEPIALAYAAAVAKKVLGQMPERYIGLPQDDTGAVDPKYILSYSLPRV